MSPLEMRFLDEFAGRAMAALIQKWEPPHPEDHEPLNCDSVVKEQVATVAYLYAHAMVMARREFLSGNP